MSWRCIYKTLARVSKPWGIGNNRSFLSVNIIDRAYRFNTIIDVVLIDIFNTESDGFPR